MAAVTGAQFLELLSGMLNRANMSGYALGYYSFYPSWVGQGEFLYNILLPTGATFLQRVKSVSVTSQGSGYGISEVPTVTFTNTCAGTGASGTALMQTINDITGVINTNLARVYQTNFDGSSWIENGDFVSGCTGWSGLSNCNNPYYCISNGQLHVTDYVSLIPNSGTLYVVGDTFYFGSFDIVSGLTGTQSGRFEFTPLYANNYTPVQPIQLNGKTGTIYFGGFITEEGSLTAAFEIDVVTGELVVDNFKFYYNNGITWDSIMLDGNEQIYFFADSVGNKFELKNGRYNMGFGQTSGDNVTPHSDLTYPYAYAQITGSYSTYTTSLWNQYTSHINPTTDRTIATWPGLELRVRNGRYLLYSTTLGGYCYSPVVATGDWHNVVVRVMTTSIWVPQEGGVTPDHGGEWDT